MSSRCADIIVATTADVTVVVGAEHLRDEGACH